MTPDSYQDLVARLTAAVSGHASQRAAATAWYEAQCAAARDSVAQADERLAAAQARRSTAREAVDFTDGEAARLWGLLAARLKVPPGVLGPPPEPRAPGEVDTREHPGRQLDRVRELLEEVRPAPARRPVVRVLVTLFLLVLIAGAVTATLVLRH